MWKLEREKLKRRVDWGKGAGGEIVRDFFTKLHSNYFRAVFERLPHHSPINLIKFPFVQNVELCKDLLCDVYMYLESRVIGHCLFGAN